MIIELLRISVPRGRRREFANTLVSLLGRLRCSRDAWAAASFRAGHSGMDC